MADYTPREFGSENGTSPLNGNGDRSGTPANGNANGHGPGPYPSHGPVSYPQDTNDGFVQVLRRQWHVVLLMMIVTGMLSVLYLLLTKPTYTSTARLEVRPFDRLSVSPTAGGGDPQEDPDFLPTQCLVINSNAVLALAMDKIRDTKTLRSIPHPLDYVKDHLLAEPVKEGKAIDVSFEAKDHDDANLIVDSVVQAYSDYESSFWKSRAESVLQILQNGTDEQKQKMKTLMARMDEITRQIGSVPDIDPERSPQHLEVTSLLEEKRKAEVELIRAKNTLSQSGKAILGHEDLVKQLNKVLQDGLFYTTDPESQLKTYQASLDMEQRRLVDESARAGPNNPVIIILQKRVNDLMVDTVAVANQWVQMEQSRLEAIDTSLKDAEKKEQDMVALQSEYQQLHASVQKLQENSNVVETDMKAVERIGKGAGALNISVLNHAGWERNKVKPEKVKTLMIGLVLGVISGLALAFVRDWTDDRMRTPQAVRTATGAQVLGAIPTITTAYTASDRGQIVHHDPFGDAAESFRTLRTALQFGLPTGAKTVLVTSAVSGDGKSTFVSNLGIAMAQASMKVLIVDADLRAPMQHRLFGLREQSGLATVLSGEDTIDQAIERTDVKGLQVLPCGPIPLNPSELLNSPSFAETLEELADRYDIVLLDSPPITAVADGRIIAACADVSVLVVRLDTTNRKQAEAARDGLRSVGARLMGVAVNGVSRGSGFAAATSYYPQHAYPAPRLASRSAKASETANSVEDTRV